MIKKKSVVKIVSFMAAALVLVTGYAIKQKGKSNYYLNMIKNQYTSSFEQLNSSINNISMAMQKVVYVTSAKKMNSLAAKIFSEAELAKAALSELPIGQNDTSTIYRFLSQVGNYVLSVAKNITTTNAVSQKQREELKTLSQTANTVSQVINDTGIESNNPEQWAQSVENKLNDVIDESQLAASLTELEENLSDYPTLIYDGPYSDHILQKQPLMTANQREISKNEALKIAEKYVGENNNLKFSEMQNGKIETFRFTDNSTNIAISKFGGYVVYMRKNREIKETDLSYEQMISSAEKYLQSMKIKNMKATYFYTDDGVCVINFAYLDGQTICYTDLIKVGVATDTGEIMLLETTGYLTNHTSRAFHSPQKTLEEAKAKLSSELEIKGHSIALIPTDAGGEVRCYEFLCNGQNGLEILVYINLQTLEEEQLYILLKSDGGTLVK
ncbi:MAG: germination protein YpeB [Clostridia bacterium]|nr:germination protein YpeB [Clostridia bacterium]